MEKPSVFEFKGYRDYLHHRLGAPGTRTGLRLKACRALNCHSTYLSQVLNEKAHLSLEHAEALNDFLHHSEEEGEFFLLLVLKGRAGSRALETRFDRRLKAILQQRNLVKSRMKATAEITPEQQNKFYSDWLYGAIHVLVSIKEFQTAEKLANALGISSGHLTEAIAFLESIGLLVTKNGRLGTGSKHIHLGADSALIAKHHTNWRFHTIQSLGSKAAEQLHFSSAVSLSHDAAEKIHKNLLKGLQDNIEVIKDSPEETAFVYTMDFYPLVRR